MDRMTNGGMREALNTAVDAIFDVGKELERRGWGEYRNSHLAKLADSVEAFRDEMLLHLKKQTLKEYFDQTDRNSQRMVADRERGYDEREREEEDQWTP